MNLILKLLWRVKADPRIETDSWAVRGKPMLKMIVISKELQSIVWLIWTTFVNKILNEEQRQFNEKKILIFTNQNY